MGRLIGKVALVTGGASGIGQAIATRFLREEAKVAVIDWNQERITQFQEIAQQNGWDALFLQGDVGSDQDMKQIVEKIVKTYGAIHIVIANAGINGVWAPIDELQPEEWDRTIHVNLRGVYLTFHYTVPYLRQAGGGVAIITSSIQGTRVFSIAGSVVYACTKAAQVAFAKKMAVELARDQIRVNVICPGSTDTHINESVQKRNLERIDLRISYPCGKVLLNHGQKIDPEEVANLVMFLCSDEARMITGTEVYIDGGMSLIMG